MKSKTEKYGVKVCDGNPLAGYILTGTDPGNIYAGYVRTNGSWYISKSADGLVLYAKGNTGFIVAWADKENLDYYYAYNVF